MKIIFKQNQNQKAEKLLSLADYFPENIKKLIIKISAYGYIELRKAEGQACSTLSATATLSQQQSNLSLLLPNNGMEIVLRQKNQ